MNSVLNFTGPAQHLTPRQWFIRQLAFWSVFAFVTSAPGVLLAWTFDHKGAESSIAMFCGILTLILILTGLSCLPGWQKKQGKPFAKALNYTLIFRGVIALAATLVLLSQEVPGLGFITTQLYFLATPDMASGVLALVAMGSLGENPITATPFLNTYLMTLLAGTISFLGVLVLSVFVWAAIWIGRLGKRMMKGHSTAKVASESQG